MTSNKPHCVGDPSQKAIPPNRNRCDPFTCRLDLKRESRVTLCGLFFFSCLIVSVFLNGQAIGQTFTGQNGVGQSKQAQGNPYQVNRGGAFGLLGGVEPAGQYPSQQYYLALEIYRRGDLATASDAFEEALRQGRRDQRGRWIDSIPPLAMMAECQWQLGNLIGTREYVDQALQIVLVNRGWLSRIDWAAMLQPNQQKAISPNLWPQAQAVQRAPIADRVMYQSGQPLTEQSLLQGGVIEEPNLRNMDMVEIIRGIAIASYRRRVLMGPLSDQDVFIENLLDSTKYPANLPAPIARTMIGAMRVTEYLAYREDRTVLEESPAAALFNGATHPLSSMVLLSQIAAMLESGQHQAVLSQAIQATHFAGAWGQPEWIGEALQLAAGCATDQQAGQVQQVAEYVAQAIVRDSPLAAYHSLIAGADASITAGDLESADRMMSQWRLFQSRRDFLQPRLNAYAAYVTARYAAANGASTGIEKPTAFDIAMESVANFALNHRFRTRPLVSMPYLYQMGLVQAAAGKQLGGTTSEKLLREYCQKPGLSVWRRDPVDAIAGILADRRAAQLARLNLALSAGYAESFLTTWNETLNTNFLHTLPLHGRFLQVRHLASMNDQQLSADVLDQRQKMGPKMTRLIAEVNAAANDPTAGIERVNAMESRAAQMTIDRAQIPDVMPPVLSDKAPTQSLPDQTAMITFTVLGNQIIGTVSNAAKVRMWQAGSLSQCSRDLGLLLREIGVGKVRGNRLPEGDDWRDLAIKIRDGLFQNSEIVFDQYEEIVIVPDGPLWYLPFELLPFPDHATDLIVDRVRLRYAPTPGFALRRFKLAPRSEAKIGLTGDLFFSPRDLEKNEATIEDLMALVPDTVRLPGESDLPSCFLGASVTDLMVAKPQFINPKSPLDFHPAAFDQGNAFGTLNTWLRFPLLSPDRIVWAGLRTPVDGGQMGSGDGLFRVLCAAHCAGTQEVLVSRWAVGGESSAVMLKEIMGTLPMNSLTDSWNASRDALWTTDLNPSDEPLLTQAEHSLKGLTGKEPLFWAGYLLSAPSIEVEQPQAE
ncbi:hypothetical protein N9D38_02820 [Rubripirellula sp.]|nr:hypothetical protein [Rubripirellula sp.]